MLKYMRKFALILCVCAVNGAWAESAAVFVHLEKQPGQEPVISRTTVNDHYLRIDSGQDGGFVLFDRGKGEVYSVSGYDKTIMVVTQRPSLGKPPIKIEFITETVDINAKLFGGDLVHYRLIANGRRCSDIFSVDVKAGGLVAALGSFYEVLAMEHARVLPNTPADVLDACDLSLHIYHSGARVKYGLPSQEIDYTGRQRILLDFDLDYTVAPDWYRLPKGYEQYHPGQIRGIDLDV